MTGDTNMAADTNMAGATVNADGRVRLEDFTADAQRWLDDNVERRPRSGDADVVWGEGPFSVSVFHALDFDAERDVIVRLQQWRARLAERRYHAITWPEEYGGLGLPAAYGRAFSRIEAQYLTPIPHELFSVTVRLIAPTIRYAGNDEQKRRFVAPLLRGDILACQLFSEPGAGSDLASLSCRAARDGDEWVIDGQKVWSSGAQFANWGELIARSDVDAPKHKGMTAFMMPMDAPGVEVRPIKQMSGGSSFNEVFFNNVRIPDTLRLGAVGDGWKVALTTLGFERDHSAGGGGSAIRVGGTWKQLLATAQALGQASDPVVRAKLIDVYTHTRVEQMTNRRAADIARSGGPPGPEGSLGKLLWTEGMRKMSDAISAILGPALIADSGEWGTYAWAEHVLGAPGYRIAGGSDEVQRNILGERLLGLPAEPRVDRDTPFRDLAR